MDTPSTIPAATLTSFAFDSSAVRSVDLNGELLFVAKDVCNILRLDHLKALERLPIWAKGLPVQGGPLEGNQKVATLRESGLYWLVLRSSKPEVEPFHRWVCEEVIPAIRRQGGYVVGGSGEARIERLRGLLRVERAMLRLLARKAALLAGDGPVPGAAPKYDAPTPPGELAGGVPIRQWLAERSPASTEPEIAIIAQKLARRLRMQDAPLGKVRNHLNSWVIMALPADLAAVLQQSDLRRRTEA